MTDLNEQGQTEKGTVIVMIKQTIEYSALTTKIRAMLRGKLTAAEYDQLIQLHSVSEVAAYLKQNTRYAKVLANVNEAYIHRGYLETLLRDLLKSDMAAFYPFLDTAQKFFLNVFTIRGEIEIIKIYLRLLYSKHPERFQTQTGVKELHTKGFEPERFAEAVSFAEFVQLLRHTQYYPMLSTFVGDEERQNLFDLEMSLDMYYTNLAQDYVKKYLNEEERGIIRKVYGAEIDLNNLLFILRAKKFYGFAPERIWPYLARRGGRLSQQQMSEIVESTSFEDAMRMIGTTRYASAFNMQERFLEKGAREFLLRIYLHIFSVNPYSIAAPLCYLHIKENEIRNMVSVIEGIRYGLQPEQIKDKIVGYR